MRFWVFGGAMLPADRSICSCGDILVVVDEGQTENRR